MDMQDASKPDAPPERRLKHGMTNIAPAHVVAPEEIAREKRTTPDVYPEVIRHLPGNSEKEKLPTLTGSQALPLDIINQRVYKRAQLLFSYAVTITVCSLLTIFLFVTTRINLEEGAGMVVLPRGLQYISLAIAVGILVTAPILFLSRNLSTVKLALGLQSAGYAVVFVAAFIWMVLDISLFFFGVGLLAFTVACLFLYARSVKNNVEGLRELK